MAFNTIADLWSANSSPAAATQATASRAAGAAGVRHVAKRVWASGATIAATAQTPLAINLRDGATGAGAILAAWVIAMLGTTCVIIDSDGLNFLGTAATAMTLESSGAGVANSLLTTTLQGYSLGIAAVAPPTP